MSKSNSANKGDKPSTSASDVVELSETVEHEEQNVNTKMAESNTKSPQAPTWLLEPKTRNIESPQQNIENRVAPPTSLHEPETRNSSKTEQHEMSNVYKLIEDIRENRENLLNMSAQIDLKELELIKQLLCLLAEQLNRKQREELCNEIARRVGLKDPFSFHDKDTEDKQPKVYPTVGKAQNTTSQPDEEPHKYEKRSKHSKRSKYVDLSELRSKEEEEESSLTSIVDTDNELPRKLRDNKTNASSRKQLEKSKSTNKTTIENCLNKLILSNEIECTEHFAWLLKELKRLQNIEKCLLEIAERENSSFDAKSTTERRKLSPTKKKSAEQKQEFKSSAESGYLSSDDSNNDSESESEDNLAYELVALYENKKNCCCNKRKQYQQKNSSTERQPKAKQSPAPKATDNTKICCGCCTSTSHHKTDKKIHSPHNSKERKEKSSANTNAKRDATANKDQNKISKSKRQLLDSSSSMSCYQEEFQISLGTNNITSSILACIAASVAAKVDMKAKKSCPCDVRQVSVRKKA